MAYAAVFDKYYCPHATNTLRCDLCGLDAIKPCSSSKIKVGDGYL